ncbi:signal peptidase II [Halobacteriovorax marinus]|uniref:Lipoprotein signal peptidase n=1 Tax=Halobacteriovorax marinus TaxID=97084 RepID=A0A1Y5F156_9BACT|nr:signal peptidase II [Halobacteriovorax marinus]
MDRIWKMALMIVGVILLDQFSKGAIQQSFTLGESISVIPGFFNLTYVQNTGAAFGMGAGSGDFVRITFFLVLPTMASLWLMWLIWTSRHTSLWLCTTYSLIFAGAVGNLIDRYSLKYVVDMFDFYLGNKHFAAFNVADSAITIAAIMLIIDFAFLEKKRNKELES